MPKEIDMGEPIVILVLQVLQALLFTREPRKHCSCQYSTIFYHKSEEQ